jgi:hypothetical protein
VQLELPPRAKRDDAELLHVQYVAPPIARVPVVTTIHDVSFEGRAGSSPNGPAPVRRQESTDNSRFAPYRRCRLVFSENHQYREDDIPIRLQGETRAPVIIEDDCWIGPARRPWAGSVWAEVPSLRPAPWSGAGSSAAVLTRPPS